MHDRVNAEIDELKKKYPNLQHGEQLNWILIPEFPLAPGLHNKGTTKLLFVMPPGYPNTGPDDFFVDNDLRFAGGNTIPAFNSGPNSSSGPAPVPGDWGWFSWHPSSWRPAATIEGGDNLMTFVRGVNMCLRGEEAP